MRPAAATSVAFETVAVAASPHLPVLCARWLPDGRRQGHEWVARNPRRIDRNAGSFKINMTTGRWADFATGDGGGDAISLAAYLYGLSQHGAAVELARMLNLTDGGAE